uniref:Uncharacterized protein n=2 Tax=Cacopsylla melanoneura TaxID=428564 RepID=A0A8D9EDW9_9HEMI
MISVNIPNFLLPLDLVPSIFPSIIFLCKQSLLSMCPSQLLFLLLIVFRMVLSSPTLFNTSSFLILSDHLMFSILLHSHISKFSKNFSSFFLIVHVSDPYSTTLQIKHFANLFLSFKGILLAASRSCTFINAVLPMAILLLISFVQLPSAYIIPPRYLKFSTCSRYFPSNVTFILSSVTFLLILITLVLEIFIFIPYLIPALWIFSIILCRSSSDSAKTA